MSAAEKAQRRINASHFPGCSVIGIPQRADATLAGLVMQAAAGPSAAAAAEMQFYRINRPI